MSTTLRRAAEALAVDRRLVSESVARRGGGTRGWRASRCSTATSIEAIHEATAAIAAWSDIGAPFEAAAARLVLGEAQRRAGNTDAAHMEWRAARSAFEAFGAVRWAEHAGDLLTDHASASPPVRSGRTTTATFRCDGDTRRICFGELTVLMRDLKGFRYLERLLADPGREFHVLDLVAVEQGSLPTGGTTGPGEIVASDAGAGLPLLDDQAREAYRRRLAEVDDDIEEATRMNDLGRVELAQRDREYLIAELTAAAGLGWSIIAPRAAPPSGPAPA